MEMGNAALQPVRTANRLDRRNFILGGCASAALVALLRANGAAAETAPSPDPAPTGPVSRAPPSAGMTHSPQFADALAHILRDAEPVSGEPLTLDLPELAENGNVVPYKIAVESPMTDTSYVRVLHLLSTANPQPVVATFHLVPASGKASVSGRMRLARTQDVVAIAEVSTGEVLIAIRKVEVTIGGCGNE